jgi:drug/metabolite transporter (DMT)-like permease
MAALYFVFGGFRLPTLHILPFGIPYGLMIAGFQIFYTLALQRGPVSHTVLIVTFNLAFAISFGILYCGEQITTLQIIGLVCIFLSLLLTVDFKQAKHHQFDIIWFLESIAAMSMNGFAAIVVKLQKLTYPDEDMGMLLVAYISGAIALYLVIRYFTVVRKQPRMMLLNSTRLLMILSCSVILGCYLLLYSIGVGNIPSVVFFPVVNIAPSTLLSLFGIFVFKDKLTRQQVFSLIFGIAATVFLCL